jgi:hypothetical protein
MSGPILRCAQCGDDFAQRNRKQRCCSKACGNQLWYAENRSTVIAAAQEFRRENRAAVSERERQRKRARYQNDPAFRAHCVEEVKQWRRRKAAERLAARARSVIERQDNGNIQ